MIISGYKVSGYNYLGQVQLRSIGKVLYHYDDRFGLESQVYSSVLRANSLQDLSTLGLSLNSSQVSNNITRPRILANGLGANNANASAVNLIGNYRTELGLIHKGNPVFQMFVAKLDNTVGSSVNFFSTLLSGKAGAQLRLLPGTRSLNFICLNNAGTNIRNYGTATNSVPLNEICMFAHLYYGAGTGSSNSKLWIKNVRSDFTSNPTHGTDEAVLYNNFSSIGNVEFEKQMSVGYDLTGKNISQCDAFAQIAFNTVKLDTRYSSLLTP
jgi:hypothetical protein